MVPLNLLNIDRFPSWSEQSPTSQIPGSITTDVVWASSQPCAGTLPTERPVLGSKGEATKSIRRLVIAEIPIRWDGGEVTARLAGSGPIGILLAHGAGTNQDHPMMVSLRDGLASAGHTVMTFNYPYTERGARSPDRPAKLIACHRAAAEALASRVDHLFMAGRSMGGRIATQLVAEGDPAVGVILYAYPLHPAGKPEKLRIDHLPQVLVPLLFFQGTRDALSRIELFDRHIATLPNATVDLLEGADHSFRGKGWASESLMERLVGRTTSWIAKLTSGRTAGFGP